MQYKIISACLFAAIAAPVPAFAGELSALGTVDQSALVLSAGDFTPAADQLTEVNVAIEPGTISDKDLGNIAGGESIDVGNVSVAITNQTLGATSSGNTFNVGAMNSGTVEFGANAFSGFNGVGNFVVNTGNNNILQGSLSVTIVGAP